MPAYKSLTLQLLRQFPLHNQLKKKGILPQTVEHHAQALKTGHQTWKETLSGTMASMDEDQISTEALALAIKDLEARFVSESYPHQDEPLSLDPAMAYVRKTTPPA